MNVVLLAGGTGGARLARGMNAALDPFHLTVITNTADDDVFHGLRVSPDTDSVLYHLAGCFAHERGFGIAGDTFSANDMLQRLGEPAWFQLGDRDLAVQLLRERLLRDGATLSEAVAVIASRLGVACGVVPMSDDMVSTRIVTDDGELRFQEWFVRERCRPAVRGLRFAGIEAARPSPQAVAALHSADVVVIAPSNPLISIDPIVQVLGSLPRGIPVVAISPIIGGRALKGPAVAMLRDLGEEPTATGVAEHFRSVATDMVVDTADAAAQQQIAALGLRVHVMDTVMRDEQGERALAATVLALFATGVP